MTFIDLVLTHTKDSESPRKYWYWAALTAIAATVKSNVYLDKFLYKLYPNIYVLLVGRSGLRKGPAVNLARTLSAMVNNTKLYSGRVSIQGVISDLAKAETKASGGPPLTEAAGFLVSSEFASFIIQDPAALTILTDLYDGHYNPEWTYMLRNTPKEKLNRPCLTLIGATNDAHIKDAIPNNAIGGGFIARTFIIYADKKSGHNPLTTRPDLLIPMEHLAQHLREISKVKGEFVWTDKARNIYNAWYQKFSDSEQSGDDSTGTLERLHDHILKTAMLISLSRKLDKQIEVEDIQEAILACQDFAPSAKRISLGQGGSVSAPGTAVLLRELIMNPEHEITKTEALQKHWAHFDNFELDRIVESLFAQKAIGIKNKPGLDGKMDTFIILNPKVLDRYQAKELEKKEEV